MNKEKNNSNKCPICGRLTHKESKYCIFHASAEEKTEDEFKERLKKYIQEIKEEDKDYNFERFIFIGDIYFEENLNVTIFKNAGFGKATFKGSVYFCGVTFEGDAKFRDATFEKYANLVGTTFKKSTYFDRATFRGDVCFWDARFKKDTNFMDVTFKKSAHFNRATFRGDVFFWDARFKKDTNFMDVTFKKSAHFNRATFRGDVFFWDARFKKDTNFMDVTFKKSAHFNRAIFKNKAEFERTSFEKNVDFRGAIFKMSAYFRRTIFKESAFFWNVTFKKSTSFSGAIFKMGAYFPHTVFKKNASFERTTFEGHAHFVDITFERYAHFLDTTFEKDVYFLVTTFKKSASFVDAIFKGFVDFDNATFEEDVRFNRATFSPGTCLSLKVKNKGIISLIHTFLENVDLKLDLEKEVFTDFTNARLRNTQVKMKEINVHILQERAKKFSEAKEIYLLLKNNFHSIGRYDDESWAFKKEKDMERKSNCHFKTLHKWLWSCFLNTIYGYGEKPERVIVSAIAIIIIFAFVFMNFGIDTNPQLDTIPKCNILKKLFIGVRYGDLLIRLKDISWEQIKNCLYFSTVTFTTLGYGDFRPLEGWSRIFAGTEAFIGAFMIALFVYSFARRTGGR